MKSLSYIKICSIGLVISGSGGMVWSHLKGNIWPGIQLAILVAIFFIIMLARTDQKFPTIALLLPVAIGVFLRLYIYLFPAGMTGFDPDTFAFQIQGIIATGSIDVVQGAYYSNAPLFHILSAGVGLVTALPTTKAISIYPVLIGILFPIITFLLVRHMIDETFLRSWAGFAGGSVAAVGTMSVNLAYQPIAQSLATLQWLIFIYVAVRYIDDQDWRFMSVLVLFLTALIFTHKLPPIIVLITFLVLLLSIVAVWGLPMRIREFWMTSSLRSSATLAFIAGGFVILQFFFISLLGRNVTFRVLTYLDPQYQSALYSASLPATAAKPTRTGVTELIIRNLHGFVLIPAAGFSWFVLAVGVVRNRLSRGSLLVILAGGTATSLIMIVTIFAPAIGGGVGRTLLIAEPILISTIILAFYRRSWLLRLVVLLVVVSQLVFWVDSRTGLFQGGKNVHRESRYRSEEFWPGTHTRQSIYR